MDSNSFFKQNYQVGSTYSDQTNNSNVQIQNSELLQFQQHHQPHHEPLKQYPHQPHIIPSVDNNNMVLQNQLQAQQQQQQLQQLQQHQQTQQTQQQHSLPLQSQSQIPLLPPPNQQPQQQQQQQQQPSLYPPTNQNALSPPRTINLPWNSFNIPTHSSDPSLQRLGINRRSSVNLMQKMPPPLSSLPVLRQNSIDNSSPLSSSISPHNLYFDDSIDNISLMASQPPSLPPQQQHQQQHLPPPPPTALLQQQQRQNDVFKNSWEFNVPSANDLPSHQNRVHSISGNSQMYQSSSKMNLNNLNMNNMISDNVNNNNGTIDNNNINNNNNYLPNQSISRSSSFGVPKNKFNSNLSTTYEDGDLQHQIHESQQQQIIPPLRIDGPMPSAMDINQNDLPRRQSFAAVYQQQPNQQINMAQFQMMQRQQQQQQIQYHQQMKLQQQQQQQQQQLQQQHQQPQPQQQQQQLQVHIPIPITPRFKKINSLEDLHPIIHKRPKFRRASSSNTFISPLIALTTQLSITYSMCVPEYDYKSSKNPRRVLTKLSQPYTNNGYDNEHNDYILYVNDILGTQENRKYLVLDILGQGTFGQVVKCQNLKTQEIAAVKVVKAKPEFLKQSLTEANILEYLNSTIDPKSQHHFVRLKDKFMHKDHLCLVFELLSSNLYELIKQNHHHGLVIRLIKNFTIQLLDALCVLKDAKIIHCDLKPENILLVSLNKPDLKVIDFGSACKERQAIYTYIQSRFYRSPEVILGVQYSSSIDMWSLGCIIAELFLGLPLLPGVSEYDQLVRIIKMFGMPPSWMMVEKKASCYINKIVNNDGKTEFKLKSIEEYSQEVGRNEVSGKQYFKDTLLDDIVMNYRLPKKNMTQDMIDLEMSERICLLHFLKGVLNMNPLERWTPQEATLHPFVTGTRFEGDWKPPLNSFGGNNSKQRSRSATEAY